MYTTRALPIGWTASPLKPPANTLVTPPILAARCLAKATEVLVFGIAIAADELRIARVANHRVVVFATVARFHARVANHQGALATTGGGTSLENRQRARARLTS